LYVNKFTFYGSPMSSDRKPEKFVDDWKRYGGTGAEMLACVLIGTFGGYGLDRLLGTKPWLTIVGFILGSIAGFRNLFRLLNQDKEKKD